ncbi:MAG TPA: helix-hairpin-helix domain-containing protein [Usitatibacter sp.]|nr:helix-hairpin-helix domain-containing protein [Usitatibacter sp.]
MKRVALLFAALLAYAGFALAAVNINSGTKEMLEALDGIGPVKAQAIIDYRKKNGPFKRLDEIKNVDGIGDATFEKIRRDIALTGSSTMPKADAAPAAPARADSKAAKPAAAPKAADDKKAKADEKKAKADEKKAADKAKADEKKAKADEKKAKAADKAKADDKKAPDKAKGDEKKKSDPKKEEEKKK